MGKRKEYAGIVTVRDNWTEETCYVYSGGPGKDSGVRARSRGFVIRMMERVIEYAKRHAGVTRGNLKSDKGYYYMFHGNWRWR